MSPRLIEIFISPARRAPMQKLQSVKAIKSVGLNGDRYAAQLGTFSKLRRVAKNVQRRIVHRGFRSLLERTRQAVANRQIVEQHHVSILTMDGLRRGNAGHDVQFTSKDTRRNLIVEEMRAEELLQLVGKRFKVGDVELIGVEDCMPCEEPSQLSGKPDFKTRFTGLGGLRARVLSNGLLRVGDELHAGAPAKEPLFGWSGPVQVTTIQEVDGERMVFVRDASAALTMNFQSNEPGLRAGSTYHAMVEVREQ